MKTKPRLFDLQIATDTEGRNYTHYTYIKAEDGDVETIKGKIWNTYRLTEQGADKFNIKYPACSMLIPITYAECVDKIRKMENEINVLKSIL